MKLPELPAFQASSHTKAESRPQTKQWLSWDDIQYHNVIFVGSPKFNSHLKDFPAKRDFVIEGG